MSEAFPILILNARPAAGKSEIIHYLRMLPPKERMSRFHLHPLHIIDDFPMLWTWFEEDHLLERVFKRPRLHTTPDSYFIHDDLWNLLVCRMDLEYKKWRRDAVQTASVLLEFSRGGIHGGYRSAYEYLSDELLQRAAALYVRVSFAESLRKNRARANKARPDSILEHSLEDEKMRRLYQEDDWDEFTAGDPAYLSVRQCRIPYVVFENEDDVTTAGGERLAKRLETCLTDLRRLWQRRPV
jgi:hypothetical protein